MQQGSINSTRRGGSGPSIVPVLLWLVLACSCFVCCKKVPHGVFPFFTCDWLYYAVHRAGGLLSMFGVQLSVSQTVRCGGMRRRYVGGLLIPGIFGYLM